MQDCQWLQKLMSFGLLRAACGPDSNVCVVPAVARQREVLLMEAAAMALLVRERWPTKGLPLSSAMRSSIPSVPQIITWRRLLLLLTATRPGSLSGS